MEIQNGSVLKIFKNEKQIKRDGKDVTISTFNTSLSKKVEEDYHHCALNVRFVGDLAPKAEKMKVNVAYTIEVLKGFLSFDEWTNSEGKTEKRFVLLITDAKVKDQKEVKPTEKKDDSFDNL